MALTRAFLTGMGLTAEQVSAVCEAHGETVDALKAQRDEYKKQAEDNKVSADELAQLKKDAGEAAEWKDKYTKEHEAYENFKTEQATKATKTAKESAYRELLKAQGVSEKRIDTVMKVTSLESLELDSEGKLKNTDALAENIKTEWADFIVSSSQQGANTQTPPSNDTNSNDYENMSMEEYIASRKN